MAIDASTDNEQTIMQSRFLAFALLAILSVVITGCTNDPVAPEHPFSVTIANLPPLGADAQYELWFSYPKAASQEKGSLPDHEDASYFSVGKFNMDAVGNPVGVTGGTAHFAIPSGYNPQLIGDALVTIEKVNDGHTVPGPRMLGGLITGSATHASGTLTADDGDALGGRVFTDTTAFILLAAPTSDNPADSVSGIWFVQLAYDSTGFPTDTLVGLRMASQPLNLDNPNWTYQSWLVRNEGTPQEEYIRMGRFNKPSGADSTGAGSGAGSSPSRIYPVPGEDFVTGVHRTLNDGTYGVVVSVEPIGFDLPRPLITLLKANKIPVGIWSHLPVPLVNPVSPPSLQFELDR
jgi:hypothetical protein